MTTAFQIGAFQFTGFQEQRIGGGGDLPAWMLAALLRGKKKRPPKVVDPNDEDEEAPEEVYAAARTPLRLRARVPVRADLGPLLAMVKARDEAEFRAMVEQIMASDEFLDA